MTTTTVTYTAKETAKLRAEARSFLNRIPVMENKGTAVMKIAKQASDNILPKTARALQKKSQQFWDEANKVLRWLENHPDNCPGSRMARQAYLRLNEIAATVHRRLNGCLQYTDRYDRLYMLYWFTGNEVWTAYQVTMADKLDKDEYKVVRYIQRNREWDGLILYHIQKTDKGYSVSTYNPKEDRERTFNIPLSHYHTITMLINATKNNSWWGKANNERASMENNRRTIPDIRNR